MAEDKTTAAITPDSAEKPTEDGKDQDAKTKDGDTKAKDQDTKTKDQSKKVAEGKREDKTKK